MCSCSCSLNQPIEARKSFLYAQLTQATYDCEVGLSLAHEKCGLAVSVLVILGVQLHFWTCNVGKFSARDTWLTRQDKQGITHTQTCARKQVGRMDEKETFRSGHITTACAYWQESSHPRTVGDPCHVSAFIFGESPWVSKGGPVTAVTAILLWQWSLSKHI